MRDSRARACRAVSADCSRLSAPWRVWVHNQEMSGSDDEHVAEYERLTAALDEHAGTVADGMIRDVIRAFQTWHHRANELRSLLHHGETDVMMQAELMQNMHAPTARDEYIRALDSTISAYLAAMGALIDVARRVAKSLPDDFNAEYLSRLQVVRAIDGVSVLRDLRNYMLHYGSAPWHFSGTVSAAGMRARVGLASRDLRRWSAWTAPSKTYLKNHDVVHLIQIVTPYENAMVPLFEWFAADFYRHKQPDLDAANDLVREVNLHLSGGVTDGRAWPRRLAHLQENVRRMDAGEAQTDYETGQPLDG